MKIRFKMPPTHILFKEIRTNQDTTWNKTRSLHISKLFKLILKDIFKKKELKKSSGQNLKDTLQIITLGVLEIFLLVVT